MDNDGSFIERIMELGIGLSIARQMPDLISTCMGECGTNVPNVPPVPSSSDSIFIFADNMQAGPFSYEDVRKLVAAGILTRKTMVWKQGMAQWTEAGKVPEVSRFFLLEKI